jgi:hypothetical protein
MILFLNYHANGTGIAINFDQLPIFEGRGCIAGANHCGDAILAGDNGAMRQHPAAIGDNG